jgi:hypothetical protein
LIYYTSVPLYLLTALPLYLSPFYFSCEISESLNQDLLCFKIPFFSKS